MLQIRSISKQYKTGELVQKALDNVSLNLRDNEFVAILGPSGSGKTTLLNIIGGLDRYDDGDLVINGVSTKEYSDREWDTYRNHSIGFVFQSYNLIQHQTVLANVELALTISGISGKERTERAKKALEQVGLGEQIHKKPNQMSGGQMQRVALARALVNDPDILLADEPTGALDSDTSLQVMNLMKEVANDRLVVMVTHNPELAEEYATRIVQLKDGRIVDDSMPFTDGELTGMETAETSEGDFTEEAAASETSGGELENPADEPEILTGRKTEDGPQKRRASMSFLTSLALSFSNLRTKKGRTILTSFAGSIGIIGIALILSLSTGVNLYIDKIQEDTMASYPITINATSFDLSSLMGASPEASPEEESVEEKEENKVYASYRDIEASSAVTTNMKENNLTAFKSYLDDESSEIHQSLGKNGIVYTYDVDFKVYSYDPEKNLVDSDADLTQLFSDENNILGNLTDARSLMLDNMSAMFGMGNQNAANFSEMTAGSNGDMISAMIKDNYDVVYGSWPNSYDEVVLVLNKNGSLNSGVLYQLGLITKKQYQDAVRKVEKKETPEPIALEYQELCNKEFCLLTASDLYQKNEGGTFSAIGDDEELLEEVLKNATRLRIVGLVKESEDSGITGINTPVAYTSALTDYIIQYSNNSPVIQAQKSQPEIDVLSGQNFVTEEPDEATKAEKGRAYIEGLSASEKEKLFSSLMLLDSEGSLEALMTTQMTAMSDQLGAALQKSIGTALEGFVSTALEQIVSQVMDQAMQQIVNSFEKTMNQAMEQMLSQAMEQVAGAVMEQTMKLVMDQVIREVLPQVVKEMSAQVVPLIMEQVFASNVQDIFRQIIEQLPEDSIPKELTDLLEIKDFQEFQKAIAEIDFSKIDLSGVDFSKIDYSKIDYSKVDFSKIDLSRLDFSKIDFSKIDLSGLDLSSLDLSQLDLSGLNVEGVNLDQLDLSGLDFSGMDLSGLDLSGMSLEGMDLSGLDLSSMDMDSMFSGNAASAEVVDYWLENNASQKTLARVYDQYIGVSDYDSNMKKFGYISYDTPSSISLYADSFEGKDGITAALKNYNDKMDEENQIVYTDYVALLTTSITTIINAISYVLIGFVAVSLFVSCIMIGIITNISVLERTKEIGVLRALGASKRNVSNVFNAETFIIGCFSGILGVGVSLLLTLPINAVIHALMGSTVLRASLPPLSALILVLISIAITMIGGLIPARKASKQDPVVALRTE